MADIYQVNAVFPVLLLCYDQFKYGCFFFHLYKMAADVNVRSR